MTTTNYSVKQTVLESSNIWDLPDNVYEFKILEIKDSRKSKKPLIKTTIGLGLLGNLLKNLKPQTLAALTDSNGNFQYDPNCSFKIKVEDKNIIQAGVAQAQVQAPPPAPDSDGF